MLNVHVTAGHRPAQAQEEPVGWGRSGLSPEIGTFGRKWYLGTIAYRVFGKLNKKNNYLM